MKEKLRFSKSRKTKKDDVKYILGIRKTCRANNINALKLNQRVWFFASIIAGTNNILERVLTKDEFKKLIEYAFRFELLYPAPNWQKFKE
jgi:hypothetical protein